MSAQRDIPYLLLTPGPLATTATVKQSMLRDWGTWDDDYNQGIVAMVRKHLVTIATTSSDYSCVLMQGSGTFSIEATIGSVLPPQGKLLVVANGVYGRRMVTIAQSLHIPCSELSYPEDAVPSPADVAAHLRDNAECTHVAVVHCESTTGILNPVAEILATAKDHGKITILDAMSSFGGITLDQATLGADFLVSSSNKCLQGVPGLGFIIARPADLAACAGQARSHSLDLYDQWQQLETNGRWRFTSPTHVVCALLQALEELRQEGGVPTRNARYCNNQQVLVDGMRALGFDTLLAPKDQSPIVTTFRAPLVPDYDFALFSERLKKSGFLIYPGRTTGVETFRVGTIGAITPADIQRFVDVVTKSIYWPASSS